MSTIRNETSAATPAQTAQTAQGMSGRMRAGVGGATAVAVGTPLLALGGVVGASVNAVKIRKDRIELGRQTRQIATLQGEVAGMRGRVAGVGSPP